MPEANHGRSQDDGQVGVCGADAGGVPADHGADCRCGQRGAPTGNVISGSELQVRDLMEELRKKSFELAVQMRVDSTESTFSPSAGSRQAVGEQGAHQPQHDDGQRADQLVTAAVVRWRPGKRVPGGQAAR